MRDNDLPHGQGGGTGQGDPGARGGAEAAEKDAAAEMQHRGAISRFA